MAKHIRILYCISYIFLLLHCDQAHYGHVSGGREAYGVMGGQAVVGTGRLGLERDAYVGSEGETDGGGGGYVQDGDREGLNRREDNVPKVILVEDPNDPLAYAQGLKLHLQIMSILGGHIGQLER